MAVITNAIVWAQFRLLGGWKNLLLTSGAYALIFGSVMFGLVYGLREPAASTYSAFVVLFFTLQCLVLLLYGVSRIALAVRADVRSGIIESHRMMPIGPVAAVLGYWLGAPIQAFVLFGVNLALGGAAVGGASLPLESWLAANAVLLLFSLFLWAIVLFFSLRSGLALWGGLAVILAIPFSQMELLELVPGFSVLASPLIGRTVFALRTGLGLEWPLLSAAGAQAIVIGLYLAAASRRYERDDVVGFTPTLGLFLLLAWVTVSVIGMAAPHEFHSLRRLWYDGPDPLSTFTTTFTLTLLLGLLPVGSATRQKDRPPIGAPIRRSLGPMAVVLVASAVALLVAYPLPRHSTEHPIVATTRTALVILAFLTTARYVLGIAHLHRWRARILMLGWILLTWCVPLLIEAVLASLSNDPGRRPLSQIAMISPVMEIFQTWSRDPTIHSDGFAGLLCQCVAAVVAWGAYRATARRTRRAAVASDARAASDPGALNLPSVAPDVPAEPTPAAPAALK